MAPPRSSRLAQGEPVNLLDSIHLGQNALVGGLDPSQRHLPYYNCGFNNGDVTRFCHSLPADLHHNVARAILALCMAEEVTGNAVDPDVLDDLAESLFGLFDEADDFAGHSRRRWTGSASSLCTTFAR